MKILLSLLFIVLVAYAKGQTVTVMDFVKVKNGKQAEAFYYYEQNWKIYRELALERNFITYYSLQKTTADSAAGFDIILITEYRDSTMYKKSEENFRGIITAIRPNGPLLLNELKPADFRQNVFAKITETLWVGRQK